MATNYISSSFEVTGSSTEMHQLMCFLELCEEYMDHINDMEDFAEQQSEDDEAFNAVQAALEGYVDYGSLGFEYSREADGSVWFRHDEYEYINVEIAVSVIQAWMILYDIDRTVSITWACTCSKPRLGEFSGGGVVITKEEIYWHNADSFAFQAAAGTLLPPASMQLAQMYEKTKWTVQENLELMDEFISSDPELKSRFAGFITQKANEEEEG